MKFGIVAILISLIGIVGFLIPFGDEKWNFLFENMIWLPVELTLTVFAFNKILNSIEERRNEERFIRVTSGKRESLIELIKQKIVAIPINCQYYDQDRNEIEIYDDIISNPKKYFNEDLFNSSREYMYAPNIKKQFNYSGIQHVACKEIDGKLKSFIERYELFFDDTLFELISNFEISNGSFGILNNTLMYGMDSNSFKMGGEESYLQELAIDYLNQANALIKHLESYSKR